MTTALILLPLAGALVVWILPLPGRAAGALAFLVALAEVALWAVAVTQFDFDGDLQLVDRQSWFSDLGVSYHVGFFGFSLWLAGLTVIVCAAAIAYAWWANRERARAYHGLMLFLTGSIVGVFAAQDLLLFYVFFEAMLIPIYVLIGVWGGPRRVAATAKFVIYTMAGSLLMLASIIAFGLSQGTFDLVDSGRSDSTWMFLGFLVAFAVKAPLFPFHGWLVDTYRESPPELSAILSGVISKAAVFGLLRIVIEKFPGPVDDFQVTILVFAAIGLVYGSLLAFRARDFRTVVAYSSMSQMSLIVLGLFSLNELGVNGAILHSVAHGLVSATLFLLAGMIETRTGGTSDFARARRDGQGAADAGHAADDDRDHRARGARLGRVRGRVPDPRRGLRRRLVVGGDRRGRDRARCDVHAPADLGRAAPRPRLRRPRRPARPARAELAVLVPLVGLLLVLSAWPAAITERSIPVAQPAGWTAYAPLAEDEP